ncbi:MAG: uncharacterized protein PWQ55_452 [Chloroflexota bacterium]|nr:uncharacterized protein [Chloroflexota bacterium]
MSDLLDHLKSLGLKIEKASEISAPQEDAPALDAVITGRWLDDTTKGVYVVEKELPMGSAHGKIALDPPQEFNTLSRFVEIQPDNAIGSLLFIDTETSSLSSGAGSVVFMVGLAYFTAEHLKVIQLFLDSPRDELEFLVYLDSILANFTTFVSYNGKSFDIPMLKSRFIMNRLPVQFGDYQHIDLLHIARRIWKLRLESRKLGDIEREILDYQRSSQEIPGWLVPQIYFDYLESADASPLDGVFYHNEIDVISLAALFIHVNNLLLNQLSESERDSRDAVSLALSLSKLGIYDLSEAFFKDGLEQGLPRELQNDAARNFAASLKRQGRWEEALPYWSAAAENDDYASCIELAKYYEHHERIYKTALQWTQQAARIAEAQRMNMEAVQHRMERLLKKCERHNV